MNPFYPMGGTLFFYSRYPRDLADFFLEYFHIEGRSTIKSNYTIYLYVFYIYTFICGITPIWWSGL